jgi:hypothetical protein
VTSFPSSDELSTKSSSTDIIVVILVALNGGPVEEALGSEDPVRVAGEVMTARASAGSADGEGNLEIPRLPNKLAELCDSCSVDCSGLESDRSECWTNGSVADCISGGEAFDDSPSCL